MQLVLKSQQLHALALHHLAYRNARPARNHIGNILGSHHLLYHGIAALCLVQLLLGSRYAVANLLKLAVAYFGHYAVVAFALGLLGFALQFLDTLLVVLYLIGKFLLVLPFGKAFPLLLLQFGNLLAQHRKLGLVVLALDCLALYFELLEVARDFVELFGKSVALHAQLCRSLIDKVYCLVWQETVGYVPVAKVYSRYKGIVLYAHLVVVLVALLQSAQYGYGTHPVGLVHHHCLEAALKSLVLLEVFLVLVESSRAYRTQLAACKRRLEDIGCIHRALALAGTNKRVYLVDK